MSLGARATKGGAKGGKDKQQDKTKATDKQTPKEKVKPQATIEQLRMANMIDRKSEDMCDVRRMVTELMEMTRRTEEEVCSALHDSDNDMVAACNLLLEESQRIQGEWQTSEKKKKKPPAPAANGEVEAPRDARDARDPRDPRSRSGPRPRRGEGEGARGRGAARGRGGARGGRGAGRGGRRGAARGRPSRGPDTWQDQDGNATNNIGDSFPTTEDWDNEEWSGSLSDTKVFTPSAAVDPAPAAPQQEDWDCPAETNGPAAGGAGASGTAAPPAPGASGTEHIPTYTYHNTQHHAIHHHPMRELGGGTANHSGGAAAGAPSEVPAEPYRAQHHTPHQHHHQPMGMSGSLSAAQSQYLSQLTQQSQRHDTTGVYTTNYGVYGATDMSSQQRKTTQRARVPPPSKIPSTAVEMPGDSGGSMFLDVQFGALEPDTLHSPPPPHQHQQQQQQIQQQQQQIQQQQQQIQQQHQPSLQQNAHQTHQTLQSPHQSHTHSTHTSHAGHAGHAGHVSQGQAVSQATVTQSAQAVPQPQTAKQVTSQVEPQPVSTSHETTTETPSSTYPNASSMLSDNLTAVESTPTSQPVTTESAVTNSTSLDKLSASMKQLGVSGVSSVASVASAASAAVASVANVASSVAAAATEPPPTQHIAHHYAHHRPKTVGAQNVYAAHHAVSHHPPVYGANVYAPQVNSTNASLTGASAMAATAYPSSVTLTQYQPMMNSYQQTSSSAGVYAGNALYTHAPYTPYQPSPQPHKQAKDTAQYDNSVASSNSLTSTSTTQTSTSKVATTTVTGTAGTGSNASGVTASAASNATTAAGGYAGGALYGGAYAYDETQIMRGTLPHHMQGGYYEVGYSGREGTFGLSAGERFGRTDAASPQQVPTALPPGYAYFYQPPPTTYQYGVYPTYGGGGNVGGVGGVGGVGVGGVSGGGKVSAYSQQQPPYDAQDSYKPAGPYNANASKSAGGAAADLTNAMYAKTHVALNKVNSYEKAGFHSGTPPPFGAGSHLYIPAPPHHHPHHHAPPQHQMDVRVNSSHNRRESGAGGARGAAAKPAASKPSYSQSYWTPN